MLVKTCNQIVEVVPLTTRTAGQQERKIIPVNNSDFRYLRFRAIGCMEVSGPNGNWDGFPYEDFEDETPGYGYKSFINKKSHVEHNSAMGIRGSIGDLPDAYLNKFNYPDNITEKKWATLNGRKNDAIRLAILNSPNQKDGAIEVLMRIDANLIKSADVDNSVRKTLERIIRMIDTGQKLTCSMGCFIPGTEILLPNGLTTFIENIRNGDQIISGKGIARSINNTMVRNYNGYIYKLDIPGQLRPIQLTPEHPILVLKSKPLCGCGCGTRVKSKNTYFIAGHHQFVYNSSLSWTEEEILSRKKEIENKYKNQLEWVEARDAEKGDYVAYPISHNEESITHITEGKARLIGYFLAEGSYLKYTNQEGETYKTTAVFSFGNTGKDINHIPEVVNLIKQEFGIEPKVYDQRDYKDIEEWNKTHDKKYNFGCTEIRVHNKTVAQFFEYHCGEYAKGKVLPQEVMNWPKNLQKNIVATYFNGDGHQRNLCGINDVTGSTISENLAYQLCYILKRIGIPVSLLRQHYEYQKNPVYIINIRGHWQDILSDIWSYEKYSGKGNSKEKSLFSYKTSEDYIFIPIRDIEHIEYSGPVYNFEVEEDNSYIANGIIVHNCNVSYSHCICSNEARFSGDYCDCLKKKKGHLQIFTANHFRDMLDKEILRPEWLKHIVAYKFDVDEILKGSSNKGIVARIQEINHKASFFELSIVAQPAFVEAWQLEKVARKQDESQNEYIKRIAKEFGKDTILDLYDYLQKEGMISSQCTIS